MSLINVFLSPSKAIIGVDTEGSEGVTGDFIIVSKMLHVPHLNVVIASRGDNGFMMVAFGALAQTQHDFDALAKAMPKMLGDAHNLLTSLRPDFAESDLCDSQQVVLAGWSTTHNRMQAFLYSQSDRNIGFDASEIEDPGCVMPWEDRWGEQPDGDDDHRGMADLAMAQTRHTKQESPGTAMGGRLLIAELTQNNLAMGSYCELSPPPVAVPRFNWQAIPNPSQVGNTDA